jgi:hypothetical protein
MSQDLPLQGLFTDSDDEMDDDDVSGPILSPIFASHYRQAHLHTHAPIGHLVYHLGPSAMSPLSPGHLTLTKAGAKTWYTFTRPGLVRKAVEKLPKLKIPGGRMHEK